MSANENCEFEESIQFEFNLLMENHENVAELARIEGKLKTRLEIGDFDAIRWREIVDDYSDKEYACLRRAIEEFNKDPKTYAKKYGMEIHED